MFATDYHITLPIIIMKSHTNRLFKSVYSQLLYEVMAIQILLIKRLIIRFYSTPDKESSERLVCMATIEP